MGALNFDRKTKCKYFQRRGEYLRFERQREPDRSPHRLSAVALCFCLRARRSALLLSLSDELEHAGNVAARSVCRTDRMGLTTHRNATNIETLNFAQFAVSLSASPGDRATLEMDTSSRARSCTSVKRSSFTFKASLQLLPSPTVRR